MQAHKRIEDQRRNPAVVRLWNAMLPLKSVVSFMNTGAHPDDEISAMLAVLGREYGLQLSHACSTRGEGGQNALGTEATEDLGMVRTREMEQAANILDMTQYWHSESPLDSIFDFGFSKSGEETLEKWGRERVLDRFVRILRQEKPDIVCPTFLDVPGQHGHHRAMTQAAHEAVILAANSTAFQHHFDAGLSVWQVKKLYLPAWSGAGDSYDDDLPPPPETVLVDAGGVDPVLGATYRQIGEWSRACHLTQGMGRWFESNADALYPLHLAWSANGRNDQEDSIVDGLPQSLGDLADRSGADVLREPLGQADNCIAKAFAAWPDNKAVATCCASGLQHLRMAIETCPPSAHGEVFHRLERKEKQLIRVLLVASGIVARAQADECEVAPGGTVRIQVTLHDPLGLADQPPSAAPNVPPEWAVDPVGDGAYDVSLPTDADFSDPYPAEHHPLLPRGPITLGVRFKIAGVSAEIAIPLDERLLVLPGAESRIEPSAVIYNLEAPRKIEARLAGDAVKGAALDAPEGWTISGPANSVCIKPPVDLAAGLYRLPLQMAGMNAKTVHRAHYPHIGTVARTLSAELRVRALSARLPDVEIGYIGGGSDRVGHWLGALGFDTTELDDGMLRDGAFEEFDTIVVGIFALRTRPELAAKLAELHGWVQAGGNLVTLYHRPWDNWDPARSAPAFLEIGKPSLRWRVTDENCDVKHLVPDHPLLTSPNRIGPEDWTGWHKERGLYFASRYDDTYVPLLEMADPGETPHRGSLISARIGLGRHTHTSLILHHQMEKLVPGAFRLMANLMAPV